MPIKREDSPEYKLMLRAFENGPMCSRDVALELGINVRNARYYTQLAHEQKKIYILSWSKLNRGPWFPTYSLGEGVDAPSPPRKTIDEVRKSAAQRQAERRKDVGVWLTDRNRKRADRISRKTPFNIKTHLTK